MRLPEPFRLLPELFGDTTVRLAVTGLSHAGKTVFITSLLHNLLSAAGNPNLLPLFPARRQLVASRLAQPQPDRRPFPYAGLLASLAADPPRWPPSTTGISELRLTVRYRPRHFVWSRLTPLATLNLDIVDYPGEWLLDLPLVDQDFETWSAATLRLCREAPRDALARDWLDFLGAHPVDGAASEDTARNAGELYRVFLLACRERHGLSLLQPGRFLAPGEFAGTPLLAFSPLPLREGAVARPGSLHALMRERYDAYREKVVKPFYEDHFRRFDRQAVLVDVLHALNTGRHAFEDARRALAAVLESFAFGRNSWLSALFGGARIDRALFLATKADHVTPSQYANLRQLLERMMSEASLDIRFRGGAVQARIVAAARCTEPGMGSFDGKPVGMVKGTLVGETQPKVLFPGEVPPAPPPPELWAAHPPDFPVFRPPRIDPEPVAGIPQIALDEALDILIGDKFL